MKPRRRLKFFPVIVPEKSLESRVSHLEGARTALQWAISFFVTIAGLGTGFITYQSFQSSIDKSVEAQVSTEVADKSLAILNAAATSESALKENSSIATEIASIATEISSELKPTSTPYPSINSAEAVIYEYFSLLNDQQYGTAWTITTWGYGPRLGSTDYNSYESFWMGIEKITIIEVALVERTDTTAQFLVRLEWDKGETQTVFTSEIYTLIFDEELNRWQIDKSELQ